jgi:asparagine synthase (glutamine-hydrolysing)
VSRLAAQHVKVVLTGEGSDETLGGYHRYRTTVYNLALGRQFESAVPAALRRATARAVGLLPARSRTRQRLGRTFLTNPSDLDALYFDNFAVFSRSHQGRLLDPALQERLRGVDPYDAAHRALAETDAPTLLDQLLYADTRTYLHELLMKQDQMSMAASIESRVPFLDHPLVEFASRLPARLKLRGLTTKYVLRAAMRELLPQPILARRKMGFPVPVGRWFRGPYRAALEDLILGPRAVARGLFDPAQVRFLVEVHGAGVADHAERLWSLANLEIWQRIFLDGESPDRVQFARSP